MTSREFFVAVSTNEAVSEEIRAFATEAVAKLDARNADHREKSAKKSAEKTEPLIALLKSVLSTESVRTTADAAKGAGISPSQASPVLRKMVGLGIAEAFDVKVKGKGSQKAYKLVASAADAE